MRGQVLECDKCVRYLVMSAASLLTLLGIPETVLLDSRILVAVFDRY